MLDRTLVTCVGTNPNHIAYVDLAHLCESVIVLGVNMITLWIVLAQIVATRWKWACWHVATFNFNPHKHDVRRLLLNF